MSFLSSRLAFVILRFQHHYARKNDQFFYFTDSINIKRKESGVIVSILCYETSSAMFYLGNASEQFTRKGEHKVTKSSVSVHKTGSHYNQCNTCLFINNIHGTVLNKTN